VGDSKGKSGRENLALKAQSIDIQEKTDNGIEVRAENGNPAFHLFSPVIFIIIVRRGQVRGSPVL